MCECACIILVIPFKCREPYLEGAAVVAVRIDGVSPLREGAHRPALHEKEVEFGRHGLGHHAAPDEGRGGRALVHEVKGHTVRAHGGAVGPAFQSMVRSCVIYSGYF